MTTQKYKDYWFTRGALSRLIGVSRTNLAYHIKCLRDNGTFDPYYLGIKDCFLKHREGTRRVRRHADVFCAAAALKVAESYRSIRAQSVAAHFRRLLDYNAHLDWHSVKDIETKVIE
jgi:hypothetical protein